MNEFLNTFSLYKDEIKFEVRHSLINFVPGARVKFNPKHHGYKRVGDYRIMEGIEFVIMHKKNEDKPEIIKILNEETGNFIYVHYKRLTITKHK